MKVSDWESLLKRISFVAAAVLVVGMAAATVFEKVAGTGAVMRWFYHSWWFIALWAVVAVAGAGYFWLRLRGRASGLLRQAATAGIHLAFLLILAGALITHVFGAQGTVRLSPEDSGAASVAVGGAGSAGSSSAAGVAGGSVSDSWTRSFVTDNGERAEFPFQISLQSFDVLYYPGTTFPMDYVSSLAVEDADGTLTEAEVSMNNILRHDGYRFYQASYTEDGSSVTLAVSHDPWGVAVSYAGYALLLLSIIGFFLQKNSGFRAAARRLRRGSSVASAAHQDAVLSATSSAHQDAAKSACKPLLGLILLISICFPAAASAATSAATPKSLPSETADIYGDLYVYYNDRVAPVQTLARDFTMKLYGGASYKGLTAEQVLTGWIFYYDSWRRDYDAFKKASGAKAAKKAKEKEEVIRLVCSGNMMKLFPYLDPATQDLTWYSAVQTLPMDMDNGQWVFIRRVQSLVGEKITFKKYGEANDILLKIKEYQVKELAKAGVELNPAKFEAEKTYNRCDRPKPLFMLCVTVGLLLFILSCIFPSLPKAVRWTAFAIAAAVWLYLTFVLGLRWYVSGHIPMSNGFETMMTLAWITLLLTCLLCRKMPLILPFGFLIGGFALLVASIGESDPKIASLMPVLSSPLLSIHVASMMISYSLFGIVMLNGISALIKHRLAAAKARRTQSADEAAVPAVQAQPAGGTADLSAARDLSLVILYPAVFCLAIGTFLGAVWANVSWGSYWAWDPKETWALITLLVYAFTLHGASLRPFRNPVFFHWYCIAAFLCVLVTYFGVNFLLGGLHSYA